MTPWLLIASGVFSTAALLCIVEGVRRPNRTTGWNLGCCGIVLGLCGFWLLVGGLVAWGIGL